jgi:1-acyl-sn-glycerol-3-phosphate acyltransferase
MAMILTFLCLGYLLLLFELRLRLSYLLARGHLERFHRTQYQGARNLIAVVKTYARFRIRTEQIHERSLPQRFILITNHQSLADIPVLAYTFRHHLLGFVAKSELRRGLPAISFALRKGAHALISRKGDFRSAHRQLGRLAGGAQQGICPVIFPEGTRTRTGRVGRFHSAALRTVSRQAALPILSVALHGGLRIARFKDLLRNLRGCLYRVKLMRVYAPSGAGRGQVQGILTEAQQQISAQVELWKSTER